MSVCILPVKAHPIFGCKIHPLSLFKPVDGWMGGWRDARHKTESPNSKYWSENFDLIISNSELPSNCVQVGW